METIWTSSIDLTDPLTCPDDLYSGHAHVYSGDPYWFLHDPAIVSFNGRLLAAWYNCTDGEMCGATCIRGAWSDDGGETWGEVFTLAESANPQKLLYVPVSFLVHDATLYAFVTHMTGPDIVTDCEILRYDPAPDRFLHCSFFKTPFLNNCAPQPIPGGYLMGGRVPRTPGIRPQIPAIARCGNDPTAWEVIRLPEHRDLPLPETAIIAEESRITAFVRGTPGKSRIYTSFDAGTTWDAGQENPIPAIDSKMYSGTLSDGRHYLIANLPTELGFRQLLTIAVTEPGKYDFCEIRKLVEGESCYYPCAVEDNGMLYITATQRPTDGSNGNHCRFFRIPVASL